jgi:hypothetical protein
MKRSHRTSDFLKYINTPLNQTTIASIYEINNIDIELCDLYHDFIVSLLGLVFNTYLGDEFTNEEQRVLHFKWCWNKNKENFSSENINFKDSKELYVYFLEFMVDLYYKVIDKDELLMENLLKLWSYLFNPNISKSRSDVDSFIEVYKLFDESLKKNIKN